MRKHQIHFTIGVETGRADAGRDVRTCLARYTKLSGTDGEDREILFSLLISAHHY